MDRDSKGRFVKGGKGGPGRPKKEKEQRYYEIALSAVPFKQWRKIIKKAASMAERGDMPALRFLADYFLGRPSQRIEQDIRISEFPTVVFELEERAEDHPAPGPGGDTEEPGPLPGDDNGDGRGQD